MRKATVLVGMVVILVAGTADYARAGDGRRSFKADPYFGTQGYRGSWGTGDTWAKPSVAGRNKAKNAGGGNIAVWADNRQAGNVAVGVDNNKLKADNAIKTNKMFGGDIDVGIIPSEDTIGSVQDPGKNAVIAQATAVLYDADGKVLKKKTYDNVDKLSEKALLAKIEADGFKVNEKAGQSLAISMSVGGEDAGLLEEGFEFGNVSNAPKNDDFASGELDNQKDAVAGDIKTTMEPFADFLPAVSKNPAGDIQKMINDGISGAVIYANGKAAGSIVSTAGGKEICMLVNIGTMKVDDLLKNLHIQDGSNKKLKWNPFSE